MAKKSTPPGSTDPSNKPTPIYILAVLALGVCLLYANTLSHGFVLDDSLLITKNNYTGQGIGGIPEIFSNHTFKGYYQQGNQETIVEGGRFRPWSIAIFALFFQIFGTNPLPYHLFNLVLYAFTGWALYRVLHLLISPKAEHRFWSIPFLASALFIAHPIHTEVVANIKCADELWCLLLCLLSLHRAVLFHDSGERKHLWLGTLYFLVACFAKENAVTFLAVIPAAIWCFRDHVQLKGPALRFTGAALGAFLFFLLWRTWALDFKFGDESSIVLINNPFIVWDGTQWQPMPLGQRAATIFHSLGKYLMLLLYPHPLSHDYYPRYIPVTQWTDWRAVLSLLAYVGIAAGFWWGWKKNKALAFAALYFLATLSIVSNIPFSVGTNLSERFIYMPSVAFCLLLGYLGQRYLSAKMGLAALAVIVALYGLKTIVRNRDWKDNLTLAQKDIAVAGQSAKLNNSLAAQLAEKALKTNNLDEKNRLLPQALGYYNKALEINPTYVEGFFGRASVYFMQNNLQMAIKDYLIVEKMADNYPDLKTNLALAFREAGKMALRNNDTATALKLLQEARLRYTNDPEINQLLQQLSQQ